MLKIGTRGSALATTQAGHVRDALIANGHEAKLHIVTTAGDVNFAPVERIGVGVFTQALREALASGEVDVAVHSFKDLPSAPDPRFELIVPRREDPREALIARDGLTLAELPHGATVGTSAPRRISQLLKLRPDLDIRPLRGNIETRMGKVTSGELDAVVLAYAGLVRGGYADRPTQVFSPDELMPAPAQGALAVESRADDEAAVAAIRALSDPESEARAAAERAILATLEAGCTAPVAAYSTATINADGSVAKVSARGGVFAVDGTASLIEDAAGQKPAELGESIARRLLDAGAAEVMNALN